MTDQIVLKGISAKGYHGVLDFEKRDGQTFVVDVDDARRPRAAGASDDLGDTVNYAEVAGDVVALIEGDSLDLIEALASRIADRVLARPLVEAVEVVVHKPEAPVGHPFTDVQVRVSRERQSHVVIAMGSNIGDSIETLHDAAISLYGLIDIIEVSPPVETDPVGGPDQPVIPQRGGDGHDPPGALVAAGRPARHRAGPRAHPRGALGPADARPRPGPVRRPGLRHRRGDGQPHAHPAPPARPRTRVRAGAVAAGPTPRRCCGSTARSAGSPTWSARWTCPASGPGPDVDLLEGPW